MNTLSRLLDIKRRWLFLAFVAAIVLLLLPKPSFAEGGTEGMYHALAELVVFIRDTVSKLLGLASSTIAAMQWYTERFLSMLNLTAKQQALADQVVAQALVDAAEAQAHAYAATIKQADTVNAFIKFNPVTGQGFQPCRQLTQAKVMQAGVDSVPEKAAKTVKEMPNGPGQLTSLEDYDKKTLEEHYKYFCTKDDKEAGLCKTVSELPNGDMQSALLHDKIDTDLKKLATKKYIEYVVGRPTGALRKDTVGLVETDALFAQKNHSDAFLSIASNTLGKIREANLVQDELGGKSPNELITERVGTYFGGKDALDWTRTMAVQAPRGLILEAVKMEGLSTWLRYQQYQQMQDMEMNLAALLLHESKEARAALDAAVDNSNVIGAQ